MLAYSMFRNTWISDKNTTLPIKARELNTKFRICFACCRERRDIIGVEHTDRSMLLAIFQSFGEGLTYIYIYSCCLVAKHFWDPMDCSPPGSSEHGISQARILEWVAISFSRGSSWSRDWNCVSCIASGFFAAEPWGKPRTTMLRYN